MIIIIASIAAITGFLFGYDEGIIAGSLHLVKAHFDLGNTMVGLMTSALPFGALAGSTVVGLVFASSMARRFGRKPVILIAGILFLIGAIGSATSIHINMLIHARLILGFAIGIAAVTAPLYIAEVAPAHLRGGLVAMYQLAVTVGIVCAYFINYLLVDDKAWRLMFASAGIPALLLVLGVLLLPESPRWLMSVGKTDTARRSLQKLHHEHIQSEMEQIRVTLAKERQNHCWRQLFSRRLLPVLALGMLLFTFQQLSGINVIIYYAPIIFHSLGFSDVVTQILATVGIGVVNMLVTILAILIIDKIGRRKLLLFGFFGTFLSLGALAVFYLLQLKSIGTLSVICLSVYIFAFAIALGPIPYIVMSEIFPLNVRGPGMGLSSLCNWGFNSFVVFTFPILLAGIGIGYTFGMYAAVCLIGLIYAYYFMPETKGVSLEDIEQYLLQDKPLRLLGR